MPENLPIHHELAIKHLDRMRIVWGLHSGQWVERRHLSEIIETVSYMKKVIKLKKQVIFDILKISSSKYYAWIKLLSSSDYKDTRPKRRSVNRLLDNEEKAIIKLNSELPCLEPERLASMLGRDLSVFVCASTVRNLLSKKNIRPVTHHLDNLFRMDEKPPENADGPFKILLDSSLYITSGSGHHFILSCFVDQFSQMVLLPRLFSTSEDRGDERYALLEELLKSLEEKPEIKKGDLHLSSINEFSACLSNFGYKLSKQSPLLYTTNRSYGLLRGQATRTRSRKDSLENMSAVNEHLQDITRYYNAHWPNKNLNYLTAKEGFVGESRARELHDERKANLDRAKSRRVITNRKERNSS